MPWVNCNLIAGKNFRDLLLITKKIDFFSVLHEFEVGYIPKKVISKFCI